MDTVSNPGRALNRDISKGESVEAEIDAFISRRDAQRRKSEPERETEAAWVAAERRQEALRRREMDRERLGWWRRLEAVYAARSRECGQRADEMEATERRTA